MVPFSAVAHQVAIALQSAAVVGFAAAFGAHDVGLGAVAV